MKISKNIKRILAVVMMAAMLAVMLAPALSAAKDKFAISSVTLNDFDTPVCGEKLDYEATASAGTVSYIAHYDSNGYASAATPGDQIQTVVYVNLGSKAVSGDIVGYWNGVKSTMSKVTEKNVNGQIQRDAVFYFYTDIPKLTKLEITDLDFPKADAKVDKTATASYGTVTDILYVNSRGNSFTIPADGANITVGIVVDFGKAKIDTGKMKVTWNGIEAGGVTALANNKFGFTFVYTVPVATVEITELEGAIEGVPVDTEASEVNGYKVTNVKYFHEDGSPAAEIVSGEKYLVFITVDTVHVPFDDNAKALWNGTQSVHTEKAGEYARTFYFNYTAPKLEDKKIDTVNITVREPAYMDLKPVTATSDTTGVTVTNVKWEPAGDVFTEGAENKVTVAISAKEGYQFIPLLENDGYATVNGEKAVIEDLANPEGTKLNPAYYVITYIFPAVEAPKHFELVAVGDPNVRVYDETEDFVFETKVNNDNGVPVTYEWYECDGEGKVAAGAKLVGNGSALLINGIPNEYMLHEFNYKCIATCGDETDFEIFSCILLPMGIEVEEPDPGADPGTTPPATDPGTTPPATDPGTTPPATDPGTTPPATDPGTTPPATDPGTTPPATDPGTTPPATDPGTTPGITPGVGDDEPDDPIPVTPPDYVFPFFDVTEADWFYESVLNAHKLGLINGKTPTLYKPNDTMTVSEAVKLAVCMNIVYKGGDPSTIKNGTENWYSTYMDYAVLNGIILQDMSDFATDPISRLDYVFIFSRALPAEAFTAINDIPTGSIPDIKNEDNDLNKAVYTFYRAGILNGTDGYGTFLPDSTIKRSEVAAIIIRMMVPSYRVGAPTQLKK